MKNSNTITLAQAIDGFLLDCAARRLSVHTISDYTNSLRKLAAYLTTDPPLTAITADQVRGFLASLANRPADQHPIGKKQARNIHTGLSALWTWALANRYATEHILHSIERPKAEQRVISPLTQEEVVRLLAACDRRTATYSRPGKRECSNARPTRLRDHAIILLLLDTGLRASELCDLQIRHADLKNRRILAYGKGDKERLLPVSASTAKALWQYCQAERKEAPVNAALFVGLGEVPLTRSGLGQILAALGATADVPDVHPHRFRHTFAVAFLRNGGNAYELQQALGHTTLEMTRVYLDLASSDLVAAHKRASPVEHWRL